ncbi:MAG: glycosyltransferase [Acidobacteriota bacterium]
MSTVEMTYVLATYRGAPSDGLSTVWHRVRHAGARIDDSRQVQDARVLVPGIPALHLDRLWHRNLNAVFTTFETSALPDAWVDAIHRGYDHCIVPHESVRRVFERSGVEVPISIAHQGYTRHQFAAVPGDHAVCDDSVFRIGFLGVPVRRKNLDKLFAACSSLRSSIPGLRLAIHVAELYDWLDPSSLEELKEAPFVEWTVGGRTTKEMGAWFRRLSGYAFPSSGEGWSFTPRESLALGVPTLLTDIPVHRELVESGCCIVIPTRGQESARAECGTFGSWASVAEEDIRRAILELFHDLSGARRRARRGARWIATRWPNGEVESRVRSILGRMRQSPRRQVARVAESTGSL